MRRFMTVFIIMSAVALSGVDLLSHKNADANVDGYYRDTNFPYSPRKVVKAFIDTNRDGVNDTVVYYSGGYRERAEQDFNHDGFVDRWIYYDLTGAARKVIEDLNKDQKPDYWVYLKDNKVYKWEQDRNFDGKPDIRTIYEMDTRDQKRTLLHQSYDDNYDGIFESLSGVTLNQKTRFPHALA